MNDQIDAVATLAEPTRRRLYDLVAASDDPVGRDDAVAALGISRELAAFHLDRLVAAGLLRPNTGGAAAGRAPVRGRPAKLYRRAGPSVEISLPPRRYERAAELMATALGRLARRSGIEALAGVAREQGAAVGVDASRTTGARSGRLGSLQRLVDVLRGAGYEPRIEPDGRVCLRNCPYDALVAEHRDLTCGMNLAWAEGVLEGLQVADVEATLAPDPSRCCVVFHASSASGTSA